MLDLGFFGQLLLFAKFGITGLIGSLLLSGGEGGLLSNLLGRISGLLGGGA